MVNTETVIVALTLLSSSFIALVSYTIALVAIVRVRKSTKNEFYWLMFAMGLSDCTMLTNFVFYSPVAILIQDWPFGSTVDALLFGFVANVTYFGSVCMLANIAANRYVAICRKDPQKWKPSRKNILLSILLSMGCGAVSAIPQLTPCCLLRFFPSQYVWAYDMNLAGNQIFVWYDRLLNSVCFICIVIAYSLIWRKVRQTRKTVDGPSTSASTNSITQVNNRQKSDVKLAVQMIIISALFIIQDFYMTFIPMITDSKWWNFIGSILYITTVGIHPFLYFKFNIKIREQAAIIVGCKKETQPDQLFRVTNAASLRRVKQANTGKDSNTSPKNNDNDNS